MPARLISIIFDEKTTLFVHNEHSQTEMGCAGLEDMDQWGDFSEVFVELSDLEEGNYTLIISADFNKNTKACFRLMHFEANKIVFENTWELQPTIDSAGRYANEYSSLCDIIDDEDQDEEVIAQAQKRIEEIEKIRAEDLEGALTPHLTDNAIVNRGLLDMIDFLTYPISTPYIPPSPSVNIPPEKPEDHKYRLQ